MARATSYGTAKLRSNLYFSVDLTFSYHCNSRHSVNLRKWNIIIFTLSAAEADGGRLGSLLVTPTKATIMTTTEGTAVRMFRYGTWSTDRTSCGEMELASSTPSGLLIAPEIGRVGQIDC